MFRTEIKCSASELGFVRIRWYKTRLLRTSEELFRTIVFLALDQQHLQLLEQRRSVTTNVHSKISALKGIATVGTGKKTRNKKTPKFDNTMMMVMMTNLCFNLVAQSVNQ